MLKAGVYLDMDNLSRNGAFGMRLRAVRELAEAQGAAVVRANAYMSFDREREDEDRELREKKEQYRDALRREGFHLVLKEIRRYPGEDGGTIVKANADLELAVDAILQGGNLDYVLLGTGDGDFVRLVRALQNLGKRVDLLSFNNTSTALRREVDNHFWGFLYSGLVPEAPEREGRRRGIMRAVLEDKGYGFVTMQTGYGPDDQRDDVFLHINDFRSPNGFPVNNESFARLRNPRVILEFDLLEQEDGKLKALNATEFIPE